MANVNQVMTKTVRAPLPRLEDGLRRSWMMCLLSGGPDLTTVLAEALVMTLGTAATSLRLAPTASMTAYRAAHAILGFWRSETRWPA